jgi:DNA sulfur modification protein DndD
MFVFEMLTIRNFALYNDLCLDLSPAARGSGPCDSVLIRGHNEHGKTTLFRGLMWTVFGKDALSRAEALSARDAMRLHTLTGEQTHIGQLVFRSESNRFRITRTAVSRDGDDTVRERVQVDRYSPADPQDPWKDDPSAERSLAAYYFPPDLAPYLFLNADKVSSIVGDTVSATRQTDEVTRAINDMLGISAVDKAIERVQGRKRDIARDLSNLIGRNNEKDRLEEAVNSLESQARQQEEDFADLGEQIEVLENQLSERKSELSVLEEEDAGTVVYTARDEARREHDQRAAAYRDAMKELRADFSSPSLYVPFFTKPLAEVEARLSQLRGEGVIPRAELPLLIKLLNPTTNPDQLCICGETSIRSGTAARATLEGHIGRSREFEEGANRLDKVRGDLSDLIRTHVAHDKSWAATFATRISNVRTAKEEFDITRSRLEDAIEAVAAYEEQATQEQIRRLRVEVEGIQMQLQNARIRQGIIQANLEGDASPRTGLRSKLLSAQRKLQLYFSNIQGAQHLALAVKAADQVVQVLKKTVRSIQTDQVAAVSDRINYLFLTITNNGALVADDQGNLPVTSKVGLREVPSRPGYFELFAETATGGSKPLAVLNGASRQALTVAFMVALLENSAAPIPIVADSLFHPLSGNVKFRLARHLLAPKVQKILFFTHDDVQNAQVRNLLIQHAARTYTISNALKPADLAHPPTPRGGGTPWYAIAGLISTAIPANLQYSTKQVRRKT